jgi:predicted DNA-binding transcriptional regulator AlpA
MTERTPTWLTVTECLKRISVARSTWDKWRRRGDAPRATRLPNGQLRINEADLQAWLDTHAETQQSPTLTHSNEGQADD